MNKKLRQITKIQSLHVSPGDIPDITYTSCVSEKKALKILKSQHFLDTLKFINKL